MSKSQKKLKWHPIICKAIEKKAVIQFKYREDGKDRTVEPQAHGISSVGNEVIRGVQTYPRDPSGKTIEGKLYVVSRMSDLKETGETFSGPGRHFNPNDKGMAYVHCSLEQSKFTGQHDAKLKQGPEKKRTSARSKSLSYSEIKKKYPNEWVLVEYSKLDKDLHAKEGQVLAHAPNKEDIYKALLKTRGKNVSVEYFGPSPKDIAVIFCLELTR